jgi:hypothetical protein
MQGMHPRRTAVDTHLVLLAVQQCNGRGRVIRMMQHGFMMQQVAVPCPACEVRLLYSSRMVCCVLTGFFLLRSGIW